MGKLLDRTPSPERRAVLAKLHVAKKQLALTDESYRDVLRRITGRESAADCTDSQLDAALKEFARLGFKAKARGNPPTPKDPQHRMIYAVWGDLGRLGVDASRSALRAFVARQTRTLEHPDGISAVEFLDAEMAARVLEGLKAWRRRLSAPRTTPSPKGDAA